MSEPRNLVFFRTGVLAKNIYIGTRYSAASEKYLNDRGRRLRAKATPPVTAGEGGDKAHPNPKTLPLDLEMGGGEALIH